MSSEVLRPACQLAFVVAREDSEAIEPVDPPAAMRSFLHVDELPRRALATAQQVIEENSEFRHRVAMRATEDHVGRAGYLWLHRPSGWAQEFEALAIDDDDEWAPAVSGDPDPMLEAVYKGLTAEPIEVVAAQPPEPDDMVEYHESFRIDLSSMDDAPLASVSPIGSADFDLTFSEDDQTSPSHQLSIDHFPPSSSSLGLAAVTNTEQADHPPTGSEGFEMASSGEVVVDGDGFEADALESELASLRGLVARLANERESDPPERLEIVEDIDTDTEVGFEVDEPDARVGADSDDVITLASPAPGVDDDPEGLSADLDAAHHELYLTRADLTIARQEREEAQRLQSEALKRQVQLEKELANVRERRAELERELTSSQARAISSEERLGRAESQLTEVDRERDVVRGQLETMTLERNQIREDRSALKSERDDLRTQLLDIADKTGGADIVELVSEHKQAVSELESTSRELARMITQADQFDEQVKSLTSETASLKGERIDLRSRLGEAETSLETTTTQYQALKIDAERMAAELGSLRAENDGLQSQLGELQTSLGEVLAEQVEGRQRNDADRRQLNELRVEYDVAMSRLSDLQQSEQEAKNRLNQLTMERDELIEGRDELLSERAQLRGELASATADRGAAQQRLVEVESLLPPMENELHMERRQREELASRLIELDDKAARSESDLRALVEERDALAATVERLEAEEVDAERFRRERDEIASELAAVRSSHNDEIQTLRSQIHDAALKADELTAARSGVEQQVSELSEDLTALRAELAQVEGDRDQARAELAELEQLRTELAARQAEVDELQASLDTFRAEVDEARVAVQVKESELRTVLGARSADSAEIERLKTSLAETMVRADGEVEAQAGALSSREAELAEREAELASLRTELEAVRSVADQADIQVETQTRALASREAELAEREAELASLRTELEEVRAVAEDTDSEGVARLEVARAELREVTGEAEALRAELAQVRVELASATAESEAKGAEAPVSAFAPPAPDASDVSDQFAPFPVEDELDSTAAEVRSVLRGPSVLDGVAGGLGHAPVSAPDEDATSLADDLPIEVPVGDLGRDDPRNSIPGGDVVAPSLLDADPPVGLPSPMEPPEFEAEAPALAEYQADDELDEVSELIARKMSTFSRDELTGSVTPTDDNIDLTVEMASVSPDGLQDDLDDGGLFGASSAPPSILGEAPESFRPAERPDLSVPRYGGSKRRRIEIPGDIIDDEVASARFVVSSPDVVLLVDGDSVAQMGWPKLPVAQQRDALVTYLADLSASSDASPDVVFDGRIGDGASLPASRSVRIRLSTPPTPPSAALDELVDAYPEQWPIALVTDNIDLATSASERGAAVLNNGQLLDLFIAE